MTSPRSQPVAQGHPAGPADALGLRHAAVLPAAERTARGVWFTPPHVADTVVAAAAELQPDGWSPTTVIDPAVGGGALLLAARRRWPAADLTGIELDPPTAAVAEAALAPDARPPAGTADSRVIVGDGLDPDVLREGGSGDLVVANPPFLGQLAGATARSAARRAQLLEWWGPAAAGYVDEAALFVLASIRRLVRPGGIGVFILPESVLATNSAERVRGWLDDHADVDLVWRDLDRAFPGVPTCALAVRPRAGDVDDIAARKADRDASRAPSTWSHLLAGHGAVKAISATTIGDVATATADFRDAYYLVAGHVTEAAAETRLDDDAVRIVPVGLIDPAHCRWGRASIRFAKQRWERPVARGLPEDFLDARLGPKVLVATQTRVLESVVDEAGDLLPTTPAITLRTDRLWHVSAALCSPVLSTIARQRHAGAARSRTALKLSARQILALPLPEGSSPAWDDAAEMHREAHDHGDDPAARHALVLRAGRLMWHAFDVPVDEQADQRWAADLPSR